MKAAGDDNFSRRPRKWQTRKMCKYVPVSSSSSKQYITSGSLPFALAAAMAAGGMVMRGKEYMAPVVIKRGGNESVRGTGYCDDKSFE